MQKFCSNCNRDTVVNVKMNACIECGAVYAASSAYAPGTEIAGFRIESELGRGGMGIVYKATQLNLERFVALKILNEKLANDKAFVESFFREARSAAGLSHPNIVQAYDAGVTPEGVYYFAMELIEGDTLEDFIQKGGSLTTKRAVAIARKIVGALDNAWEKKQLSHGDIKPENIILDDVVVAKLADLGLAKSVNETSDADVMATPRYAPPEIINGDVDGANVRSDMYSFGATFYHMLTGQPPFPGDDPHKVMQMHLS